MEIQPGPTYAVTVIHFRHHKDETAPCGAPPGTPWTGERAYVQCNGCLDRLAEEEPDPRDTCMDCGNPGPHLCPAAVHRDED